MFTRRSSKLIVNGVSKNLIVNKRALVSNTFAASRYVQTKSTAGDKDESLIDKIKKGDIPSTDRLGETMRKAKDALEGALPKDSKIAEAVSDMIDSGADILEMNEGDLLQKTITGANQMMKDFEKQMPKQFNMEFRKLYGSLNSLMSNLFRSSDVREYLNELSGFLRYTMNTTEEHYGNKLQDAFVRDLKNKDASFNSLKNISGQIASDIKNGKVFDKAEVQKIEDKFVDLLRTISENQKYKLAVRDMFNIFDSIKYFSKDSEYAKKLVGNAQFTEFKSQINSLLDRAIGRAEVEDFTNAVYDLNDKIMNDKKGLDYLNKLKQLVNKVIDKPAYLQDKNMMKDVNKLISMGRDLWKDEKKQYAQSFDQFYDTFGRLFTSLNTDALSRFSQSMKDLSRNLLVNEDGRFDLSVTPKSLNEMKSMVLPMIKSQLQDISLPELVYDQSDLYMKVSNLNFHGKDLLPDDFHLEINGSLVLGTDAQNESDVTVFAKIEDVSASFQQLQFEINKKTTPMYSDSGVADIELDGMSLELTWHMKYQQGGGMKMELSNIDVDINNLNIDVKSSKHELLDSWMTTMFSGLIKKRVESMMENALWTTLSSDNKWSDLLSSDLMKGEYEKVKDKVMETMKQK